MELRESEVVISRLLSDPDKILTELEKQAFIIFLTHIRTNSYTCSACDRKLTPNIPSKNKIYMLEEIKRPLWGKSDAIMSREQATKIVKEIEIDAEEVEKIIWNYTEAYLSGVTKVYISPHKIAQAIARECPINIKKKLRMKEPLWCSKHQVLHAKQTKYWSCRFPNSPELNNKTWECESCGTILPYWAKHSSCKAIEEL